MRNPERRHPAEAPVTGPRGERLSGRAGTLLVGALLLTVAAGNSAGCKKGSWLDAPVGTRWYFDDRPANGTAGTAVLEVTDRGDGITSAELRWSGAGEDSVMGLWWRIRDEAVQVWNLESGIEIPLNVEAEGEWTAGGNSMDGWTEGRFLAREAVRVPAGRFRRVELIELEGPNIRGPMRVWVHPQVGPLRLEWSGGVVELRELQLP